MNFEDASVSDLSLWVVCFTVPAYWSLRNSPHVITHYLGTFVKDQLGKNLAKYALYSAFKDSRFSPISKKEVKDLSCSVSLLTNFEPAKNALDWKVGVHGINIDFQDTSKSITPNEWSSAIFVILPPGRRSYGATYLPEVAMEQGWDQETTLTYLVKKAGKL